MSGLKKKNIHILIVDDSIINQEIVSDFIEDPGFSLDTVTNGLQAVNAVKKNAYSLVFMDIHMPVMDGLTATKSIREYEIFQGLRPVPIIALTSDTSTGIKQRCSEAGMNDYLLKPFSQQEILQKIRHYLTDELLINNLSSNSCISNTAADNNGNPLLDVVEEIAQVSHWFWYISEQRIQFSAYLQRHFDFPLTNIKTLDDYIAKTGSDSMSAIINECLVNKQETRWEQRTTEPGMKQPKYLLHRFRYIVCEDGNPVLISTIQDITSIRHTEQQALELASSDVITGLSSRFRFNQQIEDLIKYADRHSHKFVLLYLNTDTFKETNKSFGNKVGEKLLFELTKRIHTILRSSDFACRLIDDEFCLVIRDIADDRIVIKIAEHYLKLFDTPILLLDKKITLHARIGMALYPQDGTKATELIKAANTAMNKAKLTATIPLAFYENAMTSAMQHRLMEEKEIQAALFNNQFELYYQPRISLSDGKVESVEASVRWNHPDRNLRLPDGVLAAAEHMDLIIDIERWSVNQACKQITMWRKQGLDNVSVAVTISQKHFELPDFTDSILKIVNNAHIAPSLIEIDIAETGIRNQTVFTNICMQLRAAGFKIAIDDFGTGYASLSMLKDIPVNILKIDREFICNLPKEAQSPVIIGAILGLSNTLGLQVVAKSVENSEQLITLAAMGCDMAQGFYFSHPVPAIAIPELEKQHFYKPDIYQVA